MYGNVAAMAAKFAAKGNVSPIDAWQKASTKVCGAGTSSQVKSCPRDTFLSLCEEGLVKNVPAGHYTRSVRNKTYALAAIAFLRAEPALVQNPLMLWKRVTSGKGVVHNGQMDVVTALWDQDYISQQ